jgi:cytochrome o ubiquinol oxidase subunit 1
MPLYILGFMGMTRRLNRVTNPEWVPFTYVAVIGAFLIGIGILCTVIQFVVSIIQRKQLTDVTGDPWDGRTLEWSTSSPPPFYNFAVVPHADKLDAYHEMKHGDLPPTPVPAHYSPIHMPKNTGVGLIMSAFAMVFGFALIWHIWWLAAVSFVGMFVTLFIRSYATDVDYYVQPDEIARIEQAHIQAKATQA